MQPLPFHVLQDMEHHFRGRRTGLRRLLLNLVFATSAALALMMAATAPAFAQHTATTAPTQYVTVNGVRTGYRSFGQGSPIVMVTRMRGTLDTWDPLFLDLLAARHTVIPVDYPGVGYSDGALPDDMRVASKFVHDFATAIGLERFALLGWSWGGIVAQAALLDQPQRVTHGILIGTNPPGPRQFPIQKVFIERAIRPVNDLADEEVLFFEPKSAASREAARASHARIYARPDVVAKIPAKMEQFQTYFKAAEGFHLDKEGRLAALQATTLPLLIISGDNDPGTPGQNWFALMGKLRNAQLVMYSETGHGPQHQHPELAARAITDFLALTPR